MAEREGRPGPPAGAPWRRDELPADSREVLHPGSSTKAGVTRYHLESGASVVVKDVRPQHPLFRWLGRRILRREERVLRRLHGIPGVPAFLGRLDRDAFVQEFLPGEPFLGRLAARHPERFRLACLDLQEKVKALHERGVVHLDLRQRKNLLVDPEGRVALIDYESALILGTTGPRAWLLGWLKHVDEVACLKFKAKYAADLLTDRERARLRRHERWARLWVFHHLGALLRRVLGRSDSPRRGPAAEP